MKSPLCRSVLSDNDPRSTTEKLSSFVLMHLMVLGAF